MELRERGWSISAAAREVGVSRSSGNNWSRGYKTYRRSKVVGFVPALDRLAVREISSRFLSQDERIEIADLQQAFRTTYRDLRDTPSGITGSVKKQLEQGSNLGLFGSYISVTFRDCVSAIT